MRVRLWDLCGASSCSFQSFIIPACQAWSWASVCSYMYIKTERKGGVLIINFLLFFVCFFNSSFVYCFAFVLWDAQHLEEKICEKHFGENNHNHLTVLPKRPQTLMLIDAHIENKTNKKPSCNVLLFYLPSLSHLHFLSHSVLCMCSGGFVTVCVYLGDGHGLICTTAIEGEGWHDNTVIWHHTHWDWWSWFWPNLV